MTTWIVLFVIAAIIWFFVELAPINMRAKHVGRIVAAIVAAIGALFFVLWLIAFVDHGETVEVSKVVTSQLD